MVVSLTYGYPMEHPNVHFQMFRVLYFKQIIFDEPFLFSCPALDGKCDYQFIKKLYFEFSN